MVVVVALVMKEQVFQSLYTPSSLLVGWEVNTRNFIAVVLVISNDVGYLAGTGAFKFMNYVYNHLYNQIE